MCLIDNELSLNFDSIIRAFRKSFFPLSVIFSTHKLIPLARFPSLFVLKSFCVSLVVLFFELTVRLFWFVKISAPKL